VQNEFGVEADLRLERAILEEWILRVTLVYVAKSAAKTDFRWCVGCSGSE
jgi:hypothetical protein